MSGQKLEWDLDKKIPFSEIGPPGFTPPGFGRTLSLQLHRGRFRFGFGSWKTVPAVLVPLPVSGKTVLTVPVSGSSLVPEPPCKKLLRVCFNLRKLFLFVEVIFKTPPRIHCKVSTKQPF